MRSMARANDWRCGKRSLIVQPTGGAKPMSLCHFTTAINATPRLGWADTGGVYDLSAWQGAGLQSLRDVLSRPLAEIRQLLKDAPFTSHLSGVAGSPRVGGREIGRAHV